MTSACLDWQGGRALEWSEHMPARQGGSILREGQKPLGRAGRRPLTRC